MADPITPQQPRLAQSGPPGNSDFRPWSNQEYLERMEREPCRTFILRSPNEVSILSMDHPDRPGLTLPPGAEADRFLRSAQERGVKVFDNDRPLPSDLFEYMNESTRLHDSYRQRFDREGSPACNLVSSLRPPAASGAGFNRRIG